MTRPDDEPSRTESAAERLDRLATAPDPGLLREFIDFLQSHRKWWLAPLLIAALLLTAIIVLGSSGAAPFIYPLF